MPPINAGPHLSRRPAAPGGRRPRRDLIFFNGLGGFTPDGREYIITTTRGQTTPAPWSNVLANPNFGTVVSESGAGYTWSENAHEFRLTPWHNDPVSDASGEAFYLRDEESGHFWSPTPLPCRGAGPYVSRHGFGYSVFEHMEAGVSSEALGLRGPRRIHQVHRAQGAKHLGPAAQAVGHRLRGMGAGGPAAQNGHARDHRNRPQERRDIRAEPIQHRICRSGRLLRCRATPVGPSAATGPNSSGATARYRIPAAMTRSRLSGKLGAALDPCAAIQVAFELADGAEYETVFMLGAGRDAEEASSLAQRFRGSGGARGARRGVALLESHARRGVCGNTRPVPQRADQRLARVPDAGLPSVGAQRILPIGRRLRFPRSIAGRDGAHPRRAAPGARASAALRVAPVPRGRRAALVASPVRPRACAPTARTTTSGCPWRPAAT